MCFNVFVVPYMLLCVTLSYIIKSIRESHQNSTVFVEEANEIKYTFWCNDPISMTNKIKSLTHVQKMSLILI